MNNINPDITTIKDGINRPISIHIFITLIVTLVIITGLFMFPFTSKFSHNVLGTRSISTFSLLVTFIVGLVIILYLFIIGSFTNTSSISYPLQWFSFFSKLKYVIILIIFIISLILLFTLVNFNAINYYAPFVIIPILIIAFWLFNKSLSNIETVHSLFINYNFLKYSLTFFCFIMFILTLYFSDPGGYITKYSGSFLTVSFSLLLFGFIFLLTFLNFNIFKTDNISSNTQNSVLSGFSIINLIAIIVSLGFVIYYFYTHNKSSPNYTTILILCSIIYPLWIMMTIIKTSSNTSEQITMEKENQSLFNKLLINGMMLLFGSAFSTFFILWLIELINKVKDPKTTSELIINLIIVISGLSILFKILSSSPFYKSSPWIRIIVDTILYIPCIVVNIFNIIYEWIIQPIINIFQLEGFKNTSNTSYIILVTVILLYIFKYIIYPYFYATKAEQNGILLVNNPIKINTKNILGNYIALNDIRNYAELGVKTTKPYPYNYEFAISLWTYIDENTNNELNNADILNLFDIIKVEYDSITKALKFLILNNDTLVTNSNDASYKLIYTEKNILLQRWNNIILNYSNGTFDIFYNGKLIKSAINVVPEMSYSSVIIGDATTSINGGICNVIYFNTSLNNNKIYNIYNSVKNANPPVPLNNNVTIIPETTWKKYAIRNQEQLQNDEGLGNEYNINIPLSFKEDVEDVSYSIDKLRYEMGMEQDTSDTNYLSLKWFFKNNGDKYSGLE